MGIVLDRQGAREAKKNNKCSKYSKEHNFAKENQ